MHKRAGHKQGTSHKTLRHIPRHVDKIIPQRLAYKTAGHTRAFLGILSPVSCLKMGTAHSCKVLWDAVGFRKDSKRVPPMFKHDLIPLLAARLVLCPATAAQQSQVEGRTETGRKKESETGIVIGTGPSHLRLHLHHRTQSPCTRPWRSHC